VQLKYKLPADLIESSGHKIRGWTSQVWAELLGTFWLNINKNDFNIVRTDYISVHLTGSTPQNTARAQRESPGVTIFLVVSFQDDAELIVTMCMRAKLESGVQCNGRNCYPVAAKHNLARAKRAGYRTRYILSALVHERESLNYDSMGQFWL